MLFKFKGNELKRDDGKGVTFNGNEVEVDEEILGGGGISDATLELSTNTDGDPIINLTYHDDDEVLNSPIAFDKAAFEIVNNHMNVKSVGGVALASQEGKKGYIDDNGSFVPFKSGALSVELLKRYYDNTKTAHTVEIENINNYDILVFSFNEGSSLNDNWFFTSTSTANNLFLITTTQALKEQTDGITSYSIYQTSSYTTNVKYISDTQLELIKSNAFARNWLIYGVKVN